MSDERIYPVDEVRLLRAAACDWRLSRGDVGVLAVILEHCDGAWRAFPGPVHIATRARLAVTNVKASIRRLERHGYLNVERPGPRIKNRYEVLQSPTCPTRYARMPNGERATRYERVPSHADTQSDTGHADMSTTGYAGMRQLGMPARQEVASKALLNSQEHVIEHAEGDQQTRERRRAEIRVTYAAALLEDPRLAACMENNYGPWLKEQAK